MAEKKERSKEINTVLVGTKPLMNYVNSLLIQFEKNNAREVKIKARGKFISKAVDIAEVAKKKIPNTKILGIETSSAQFKNKEDKNINISTIEIKLSK